MLIIKENIVRDIEEEVFPKFKKLGYEKFVPKAPKGEKETKPTEPKAPKGE